MRFAAKLMIGPCRNVLLTDVSWPAYEGVFERERRSSTCRRTRLLLRRRILYEGISPDDFIALTVRHYIKQGCDGLFIPLVDNLGVRLPVERLVERLRQEAELRFVVVDGAQAIGLCHSIWAETIATCCSQAVTNGCAPFYLSVLPSTAHRGHAATSKTRHLDGSKTPLSMIPC